jgi:putative membrane protein
MWSTFLPVLHLALLPAGMATLLLRAQALGSARSRGELSRVFFWDNAYGLVALLWIVTGLLRVFGPDDKGTDYYAANAVFWVKMGAFFGVFLLELLPMVTFVKWRIALKRGAVVDLDGLRAPLLRRHFLEASLLIVIALAAATMARGIGLVSLGSHTLPVASVGSNALARGEQVYRERCSSCHGLDGRGQGGRVAADFVTDASRLRKHDEALLDSIARGVPGSRMPGFDSVLRPDERRDVLAYIRGRFGRASAP